MKPIRVVLLVIVLLLLIGALPVWPYAGAYGYWPSGTAFFVLLLVLVLIAMGVL